MSDRNQKIIEEFRANGGKVGGPFEGAPMVLLHTAGAKSGAATNRPGFADYEQRTSREIPVVLLEARS